MRGRIMTKKYRRVMAASGILLGLIVISMLGILIRYLEGQSGGKNCQLT
jgi:hypothetical protein